MRMLIVDDEPLARSRLKRLLVNFKELEYVGEAGTAKEALNLVNQHRPDVVFLDIEMPGEDGLSLAEKLNQGSVKPAIILVTAHPEHALDAYRVAPVDYLLKPVDPARLKIAVDRLAAISIQTEVNVDASSIWMSYQVGHSLRRVPLSFVLYFVAQDKVVKMLFDKGEAIVDMSLNQLEASYSEHFLRIHRSFLVNKDRIFSIETSSTADGYSLSLDGCDQRLPISRRHLKAVKHCLINR